MRHSKRQGRDDFTKIPNGVPGIETRLPLVYDEGVHRRGWTSSQVVSTLSTKPAQLFGLFPAKGTLAEGSDADVVLFDPNEEWTINAEAHNSRVDYSLYEGRRVKGRVKKVFLRGDLVVDGDEWLGREGMGRFLNRSPVELNEFSG